jgi:hypothetical protein
MERWEFVNRKRQELVEVARAMLDGRLDLIVGCRRVLALRFQVSASDDEVFVPFQGFDSQTDHLPKGDVRRGFAPELLERFDAEEEEFLRTAKTEILRSCQEIIGRFGD